MRPDLLHVVAVVANPIRWESRLRLYRQFEERMLDSGVQLTTVECAYGESGWYFVKLRPDKTYPNNLRTFDRTLVNIKEDIQTNEFHLYMQK